MRTSLSLAAAAVLTIGLSACGGGSGGSTAPAPAPAPASQAPSSAPASQASSGTKSGGASSAPASKSSSSGGDNSGAGGAVTPEAAAEALLHAAGNKNAQAVCDMMSIQGKPVNVGGTGAACTQQWNTTLQNMGNSLDSLKSAKVTNVKITGDTADLKGATITPAEAKAMMIAYPQAKKINGKWYVQLGAA